MCNSYGNLSKNENKLQDKNISFIGTKFLGTLTPNLKNLINNNGLNVYKMLMEFWQTKNFNYEELMQKYCSGFEYNDFDIAYIFDYRSYVYPQFLIWDLNYMELIGKWAKIIILP